MTRIELMQELLAGKTIRRKGTRYRFTEERGLEAIQTSDQQIWQRISSSFSDPIEDYAVNPHTPGTLAWAKEEMNNGWRCVRIERWPNAATQLDDRVSVYDALATDWTLELK